MCESYPFITNQHKLISSRNLLILGEKPVHRNSFFGRQEQMITQIKTADSPEALGKLAQFLFPLGDTFFKSMAFPTMMGRGIQLGIKFFTAPNDRGKNATHFYPALEKFCAQVTPHFQAQLFGVLQFHLGKMVANDKGLFKVLHDTRNHPTVHRVVLNELNHLIHHSLKIKQPTDIALYRRLRSEIFDYFIAPVAKKNFTQIVANIPELELCSIETLRSMFVTNHTGCFVPIMKNMDKLLGTSDHDWKTLFAGLIQFFDPLREAVVTIETALKEDTAWQDNSFCSAFIQDWLGQKRHSARMRVPDTAILDLLLLLAKLNEFNDLTASQSQALKKSQKLDQFELIGDLKELDNKKKPTDQCSRSHTAFLDRSESTVKRHSIQLTKRSIQTTSKKVSSELSRQFLSRLIPKLIQSIATVICQGPMTYLGRGPLMGLLLNFDHISTALKQSEIGGMLDKHPAFQALLDFSAKAKKGLDLSTVVFSDWASQISEPNNEPQFTLFLVQHFLNPESPHLVSIKSQESLYDFSPTIAHFKDCKSAVEDRVARSRLASPNKTPLKSKRFHLSLEFIASPVRNNLKSTVLKNVAVDIWSWAPLQLGPNSDTIFVKTTNQRCLDVANTACEKLKSARNVFSILRELTIILMSLNRVVSPGPLIQKRIKEAQLLWRNLMELKPGALHIDTVEVQLNAFFLKPHSPSGICHAFEEFFVTEQKFADQIDTVGKMLRTPAFKQDVVSKMSPVRQKQFEQCAHFYTQMATESQRFVKDLFALKKHLFENPEKYFSPQGNLKCSSLKSTWGIVEGWGKAIVYELDYFGNLPTSEIRQQSWPLGRSQWVKTLRNMNQAVLMGLHFCDPNGTEGKAIRALSDSISKLVTILTLPYDKKTSQKIKDWQGNHIKQQRKLLHQQWQWQWVGSEGVDLMTEFLENRIYSHLVNISAILYTAHYFGTFFPSKHPDRKRLDIYLQGKGAQFSQAMKACDKNLSVHPFQRVPRYAMLFLEMMKRIGDAPHISIQSKHKMAEMYLRLLKAVEQSTSQTPRFILSQQVPI